MYSADRCNIILLKMVTFAAGGGGPKTKTSELGKDAHTGNNNNNPDLDFV